MKTVHGVSLLTFKMISFLFLLIALFSCDSGMKSDFQRESPFNSGWKFIRADVEDAHLTEFDDQAWRSIDLPHDFSIEDLPVADSLKQIGPFSEKSAGGASTGHVMGGTAWYRKHFTLERNDLDKLVKVLFDGVYMDADVWINGNHLGKHPYGYTAFYFDLTPHLNPAGKENVLAIQVKNEGKNSRWYSGSGIYRDVKLIKTNPVYIDIWGISVTTPQVSNEKASVIIATKLVNSTQDKAESDIIIDIKSKSGDVIASSHKTVEISANESKSVDSQIEILNPSLWSPETPELYTAVIKLIDDGKTLDEVSERFGIRSLEFSAEKGFLLNGKSVELKGGCLHHDNGPLGSAAFKSAEYRRVKVMKDNGFNAIRTAHNPPSKLFLDACDELGILVMDESFDHWQKPKNPMDYHRFFDEWWERDIEAMVMRDRNHPSVIIWSVGNEIQERADSSGLAIFRMLSVKVHSFDPTRPVTQAVCGFWDNPGKKWDDTAPVFAQLGVHGYNYQWQQYEADHAKYPERIMIGTESVAKEAFENWQLVEEHPYIIGDFVWTGMDYLGESGIGHTKLDDDSIGFLPPWPWFNANCGDISILGDKKPQMYFRDVVWRNSDLEMLVHAPLPKGRKEIVSFWGWPDEWKSWNWAGHENELLEVSVYSRCDQVRLELNGQVIGNNDVSEATKLKASFRVPWQPGELVAIGIADGKEKVRQVLKTAGNPFRIKVTAEKDSILLLTDDLAWFNIEIQDKDGNLVPDASLPLKFEISGGKLQAVASGNPSGMQSFQQPEVTSFRGKCQVIVRLEDTGEIVIRAMGANLESGSDKVNIQK